MRTALLFLIILPFVVLAETAYITDKLRLGLHEAADTSDRAFRTLESGQELEIISRDRNYARIRLPDGEQGHVKAAYLVSEKPARLIVSEMRSSNEKLRQEIESTKAAFASPAATIEVLEQQVAENNAALDNSIARVAELSSKNENYQDRYSQYKYSLPFKWVGGAMFVCLLSGFLTGLWWIDYQSRKRHGGVRIF
jgi:SH3 domain protein